MSRIPRLRAVPRLQFQSRRLVRCQSSSAQAKSTSQPTVAITPQSADAQQIQPQALPARRRPPPRGGDVLLYLTALTSIIATPFVIWYWYQHRKEHMGKKKEELLRIIEEKRRQMK